MGYYVDDGTIFSDSGEPVGWVDQDGVYHWDDYSDSTASASSGGGSSSQSAADYDNPYVPNSVEWLGDTLYDGATTLYNDAKSGAAAAKKTVQETVEHGQDDATKLLFGLTVTETVVGAGILVGLYEAYKRGWL